MTATVNIKANVNMGQMMQFRLQQQKLLQGMRRPKLEENAAFTSIPEEEERTIALSCYIKIKKNPVTAIIDTGTTVSIMTYKLMKKLRLDIDEPSQIIIVTANGQRKRALKTLKNVPL